MADPLFLLIPPVLGAWGVWLDFVRRRLRVWQGAAEACGLHAVKTSGWKPRLTAQAGPLTVEIASCDLKGWHTRIAVRIPGPPDFHNVSIRRDPLFRSNQEIAIGDPLFDSTFSIAGPVCLVLAILDAKTRHLILRANSEGWLEISAGRVQVKSLLPKDVPSVLPLLLDIGRRLAQPVNVPQHLARNAHRDPEPGVRLQNLLLLIRELPEDPWTIKALHTARSDPSPEMRLLAAQKLGAEGRDLLLDLAESLEDDAVSAEAVSILDRELSIERTKAILDQALGRSFLETARACLEALGKSGDAAAVEPSLLLALQREERDVQIAAVGALGRAGSAGAVPALKEVAERSPNDLELRRATRQAIAEIQSRLPGASPGQLTLASTEAGQLSLAQDEAGQLSLAADPAGKLSLAQAESGPPALPQKVPGS